MSTHNIPFSKQKPKSLSAKELKNEFETVVVNEQSVFKSLKVNYNEFKTLRRV